MNKEKLKSLAMWLVIGVLGSSVVGGAALALSGNLPIGIENCNNCSFTVAAEKVKEVVSEAVEGVLGASGTRMPNGISADTTSPVAGEVRGTTLTITGATTISGTSTLGYTPNQLNTPRVAFNSNTTTYCAVQNTSGVDRAIPSFMFGITGSSGSGGLTQWRAYVSAAPADMNTAATATLFRQTFIAVAATDKQVFGGPVPGSYYTSTTPPVDFTGIGTNSTTPVIWPNGWWVNVTSTAITSSTGNCLIASTPI